MSSRCRKTPSKPSGAAHGPPVRSPTRSLRSASSLAFPDRLPDLFDLFHMIDIVPGNHLHHPLDGFFPPFLVHAEFLPFLRGERSEQRDVLLTHFDKEIQLSSAVRRIVSEVVGPLVLVVRLNPASRFCDRHAGTG